MAALRRLFLFAALAWAGAAGAAHPPLLSGVAGFDIYRDGRALHLLTAEFHAGQPRVLLYRRSNDEGASWTAPVRVNDAQASVYDIVRGNDPQIAARGERIVVVWTANGSGYGGSGPLVTAVSHDGGRTWRPGANPADDASDAGHAYIDISAGPAGFDLVWLDARDGAQGLRHASSRDGLTRWSRNATVQKTTCECCWNSLLRHGDQLSVMVRGKDPRDMLLFQRNGEAAWQRRSTVGEFRWDYKGCPHTGGGLALSGSGQLHAVVWTGADSAQGLHYLQSTDGVKWTSPHRVGSSEAQRADIAAAGRGRVLIAWDQVDGKKRVIYAMQSLPGGRQWRKPRALTASDVDAVYPRVVGTDSGFLVVWTQTPGGGDAVLKMRRVAFE